MEKLVSTIQMDNSSVSLKAMYAYHKVSVNRIKVSQNILRNVETVKKIIRKIYVVQTNVENGQGMHKPQPEIFFLGYLIP